MISARNVYKELRYVEWRNFDRLIGKAMQLIAHGTESGSIRPFMTNAKIGSGAVRAIKDYWLDDTAIELINKISQNKLGKKIALRNETVILTMIEKYCKAKKLKFAPQFPLGGFVYDCCVDGSALIEFDELHHSAKRQRKIDADKDLTAAGNNFTLHRFSVEHDIVDILLVLESMAGETAKFKHIAEAYLSEHQETKNFLSGFGKKRICGCSNCKIARNLLAKSGIEPASLTPEEDIKKLERRKST